MSAFTATSEDRMLTDKERMERFHIIRDFLAGRFASLSLYVFKTNLALGLSTNVPGFDDEKWQDTPKGMVFASNMAVSCDGFANRMHIDKDHTRYAFGLFGLINRETGLPCSKEEAKSLGSVEDLYFVLKPFGIKIALSRCNGIYEMLWDTKVCNLMLILILHDLINQSSIRFPIIPRPLNLLMQKGSRFCLTSVKSLNSDRRVKSLKPWSNGFNFWRRRRKVRRHSSGRNSELSESKRISTRTVSRWIGRKPEKNCLRIWQGRKEQQR